MTVVVVTEAMEKTVKNADQIVEEAILVEMIETEVCT